jgi:cytosine deaminase
MIEQRLLDTQSCHIHHFTAMSIHDEGARIAFEEARAGLAEGGIPVGSAIVSPDGKVLGRGRNMRSVTFIATIYLRAYMLTTVLQSPEWQSNRACAFWEWIRCCPQ